MSSRFRRIAVALRRSVLAPALLVSGGAPVV